MKLKALTAVLATLTFAPAFASPETYALERQSGNRRRKENVITNTEADRAWQANEISEAVQGANSPLGRGSKRAKVNRTGPKPARRSFRKRKRRNEGSKSA